MQDMICIGRTERLAGVAEYVILFYSISLAAILHYWYVYVHLSHIIKITYLLSYLYVECSY